MKIVAPLFALWVLWPPLGFAHPASPPQPVGKVLPLGNTASALERRAASQDASCPQGYLCQKGSCGDNVYCDFGEVCVNFEGASACASSNLKLCALNPGSMMAVACAADGVCCHGNCYAKGTVCCDRPSVQCTIGESCNACAEGLTCGSTGCVGASSTSKTSSSAASPPPTSTTQKSTSKVSSATSTKTTNPVASPTPLSSIGSWTLQGCWSDSTSGRALVAASYIDTTGLTPEACVAKAKGFRYVGFENSGECYWGYTRSSKSTKVDDSMCSAACAGDRSVTCGGDLVMNLYENSEVVPPTPTGEPAYGDWSLQGCWSDSDSPRALEHSFTDGEGMSIRACSLKAAGYKYFGVEAGKECWYGNTLDASSQKQTSGCNTACVGWITQQCGGNWRLSLYLNLAYVPGASSTSTSARTTTSTSISSTSKASSTTIRTTSTTVSSTVGSSSTVPSSTGHTITSTSQPPPSPTIVPSVGSFKKPTCFFDSTNPRMLANGSSVDHSSTGMTVEKCIKLADSWRYAGVEFGGECYWGDVPQNPEESNQQDCVQPCDGDPRQICGSGNRILRYEDEDWEDPTRTQLAEALQEYYEQLAELQDAIQKWHDLLQQYEDEQPSGSGVGRRQLSSLLAKITEAWVTAKSLVAPYTAKDAAASKSFNIARRYGTINQAEFGDYIELRDLTETSISSIQSASAGDVIGGLAIKIAKTAIRVLGNPYVTAATGVFALIKALSLIFSSPGGPPDDPPKSTSFTSTIVSSTTSCSPTMTPTPMVVLTQPFTSDKDAEAVLNLMPSGSLIDEDTFEEIGFRSFLANLDNCNAELLVQQASVAAVSLNAEIQSQSNEVDKEELQFASRSELNTTASRVNNATFKAIPQQNLAAGKSLTLQSPAPAHLRWLSTLGGKAQSPSLAGSTFYDTDGYLYDPTAAGNDVVVYVLDDGVMEDHVEFMPNGGTSKLISQKDARKVPRQRIDKEHGNLVASLAAGAFSGVAKSSRLVSIVLFGSSDFTYVADLARGMAYVASDVAKNNRQGKAVIVMSWGVEPNKLWWDKTTETHTAHQNPFPSLLQRFYDNGIVVVNAAANSDQEDLAATEPTASGGRDVGLIVVGRTDITGQSYKSSHIDSSGKGILSLYAVGHVVCGAGRAANGKDLYRCTTGASFSAPQVAGLAAYYLSIPAVHAKITAQGNSQVSLNMKNHLRQVGLSRKGVWPDGVPRAALDEEIDCQVSNPPTATMSNFPSTTLQSEIPYLSTYPELGVGAGINDFNLALHPAAVSGTYVSVTPAPTCMMVQPTP
ncbi:hypothetical protein V8C42DRAFT_360761 [Trichoderma barbatum]